VSALPVTLITGARKGVGKYLAQHYVQNGHIVIGCSRDNADWCHNSYKHFHADVADESSVQELFSQIAKQYGRLDHLVNNAGVASMNHCLLTPSATVRRTLDTNVVGTFLFCQHASRLMARRNFGRIVNFSTVAVKLKLEGEAVYAASKAAVTTLTEILARELAAFNITVNAVAPSPIATDLIKHVPTEKLNRLLDRQAIHRLATLEDVANVTDFFLRKESDFITGQVICLGGV